MYVIRYMKADIHYVNDESNSCIDDFCTVFSMLPIYLIFTLFNQWCSFDWGTKSNVTTFRVVP